MKTKKILFLSILLFAFIFFSFFSWLYYSGRINTYQPLTIKNANNEKVNFKVYGTTPLGRVFSFIQRDSFKVSCYYSFCKQIDIQFQASNEISKHDIIVEIGKTSYRYQIFGSKRFIKPAQDRGNNSYWGALFSVLKWSISKILLKILFIATIIFLLLFNIKKLLNFLNKSRKTLIIYFNNYIIAFYKFIRYLNNTIQYSTLSIILCVFAILPFLYLSFFTFPTPEEISTGADTYNFGLKYMGFIYFIMNGRFFTNFLYMLSPLTWHSILGYQIMNFAIIICLCVSSYFFISSVFKEIISKKKILEYSLLLILLFNCLMPGIAAGYYWLIGVLAYLVPLILFLILLSLIIRNGNKKFTFSKVFIIGMLVLMLCFSVEMYLPIISSFLFILILISFYYNRNNKWYYLGFFILTIIAALIIFSSPGHSSRITQNHPIGTNVTNLFGVSNILQALDFSFQSLRESFYRYVVENPVITLLSILAISVFYKINLGNTWLKKIVSINPLWSSIGFILLMILPVIPYYIVAMNGNLYLDRLFNIICFLFILAWFYNLFVIIVFIKKYKFIQKLFEILKNKPLIILLRWVVIIFFIVYVFYPKSNIYIAYSDIFSGRAADYRRQMEIRFEKMNRPLHNIYENHSLFIADYISVKPRSIHYQDYDVTGFENYFREGVANYYHVNEVRYFTDTIPYSRPFFLKKSIFYTDDFKNIEINSGKPVFGIGLFPSFLCGLYGTFPLSEKWFLYKDFNFSYNMYDSTLRIFTRLWTDGNSDEYLPIMNVKFSNIKGDTTYSEIMDTLKPKNLETNSFIVYDKLKLNLSILKDKRFVDAILDNHIRFELKSRIIKVVK